MKHWFVIWLETQAKEYDTLAQTYRDHLDGTTVERNLLNVFDSDELADSIRKYEGTANRLREWARLVEDMIACGLEELAISYYDAKQCIEPNVLPLRPQKAVTWTLGGIAEELASRLKTTSDPLSKESLDAVYKTIVELEATGMSEIALRYYQRAMLKYPELNLPEPEVPEEDI